MNQEIFSRFFYIINFPSLRISNLYQPNSTLSYFYNIDIEYRYYLVQLSFIREINMHDHSSFIYAMKMIIFFCISMSHRKSEKRYKGDNIAVKYIYRHSSLYSSGFPEPIFIATTAAHTLIVTHLFNDEIAPGNSIITQEIALLVRRNYKSTSNQVAREPVRALVSPSLSLSRKIPSPNGKFNFSSLYIHDKINISIKLRKLRALLCN